MNTARLTMIAGLFALGNAGCATTTTMRPRDTSEKHVNIIVKTQSDLSLEKAIESAAAIATRLGFSRVLSENDEPGPRCAKGQNYWRTWCFLRTDGSFSDVREAPGPTRFISIQIEPIREKKRLNIYFAEARLSGKPEYQAEAAREDLLFGLKENLNLEAKNTPNPVEHVELVKGREEP